MEEEQPTATVSSHGNVESTEQQQEEYRREYELQIRRMSCYGCGETPLQ